MKHSTFYKDKGKTKIYTTISNTPHHQFLCDIHHGTTYLHQDTDPLYFINDSMPLDKPLNSSVIINHELLQGELS